MVGTIGGQSPSFTSDRMSARAGLVRDDRRVNPPLSTMSTSAGLTETPLANPSGDGVGVCALTGGRLAHLRGKFLEIRLARVEGVLTPARDVDERALFDEALGGGQTDAAGPTPRKWPKWIGNPRASSVASTLRCVWSVASGSR